MPARGFAVPEFEFVDMLVGVWCGLGALMSSHRAVIAVLGRVSHWLVPTVFIAVGVLILVTTSTLTAIRQAI